MNFGNMTKLMGAWGTFQKNHPKFPAFCKAVSKKGLREGSVIEVIVTTQDGEKIETSIKVQESDIELIKGLGGM